MKSYERSHLADQTLEGNLVPGATRIIDALADHLADLGEFDARKLYLPAAYPSMLAYCKARLPLPEDTSRRHIHAARTARRFPAILPALADGRLHLSGVLLLAPHLTTENADELLTAAAHRSKFEIEQLIAERFPRLEFPTTIRPIEESASQATTESCAPERTMSPAPAPAAPARATVRPIAPQRFEMTMPIDQETLDVLQYAQALLGNAVPAGDMAAVLKRLVIEGAGQIERHKFGTGARSRPRKAGRAAGRYVPMPVRREVWLRDGGRCTYVCESGQRCEATEHLEFDHVLEAARGGEATVDDLRLLCRAHNQYQAEQTFGVEFMRRKREAARERAQEKPARATALADAKPKRDWDPDRDVEPWLNALGVRGDDLARGAAAAATIPDAPLEKRVRFALSTLTRGRAPRGARDGDSDIAPAA